MPRRTTCLQNTSRLTNYYRVIFRIMQEYSGGVTFSCSCLVVSRYVTLFSCSLYLDIHFNLLQISTGRPQTPFSDMGFWELGISWTNRNFRILMDQTPITGRLQLPSGPMFTNYKKDEICRKLKQDFVQTNYDGTRFRWKWNLQWRDWIVQNEWFVHTCV